MRLRTALMPWRGLTPAPWRPPARQVSRLTLVDLAGSERTKKSGAAGDAMREAAAINKSLSFLEQVVGALARKDAHVPFRWGGVGGCLFCWPAIGLADLTLPQ